MEATRLIFIRHGESEWNAAGRWQGQGDPPLSPRGRGQAERLAESLAGTAIETVVTSDLARARETAAILAERVGAPLETDARLRELDAGRWSGLARDEIAAGDAGALAAFEGGDPRARAGGGECRLELARRAATAVTEIASRHAGHTVAVVTHLGVLREVLPGSDFANAEWREATPADLTRPRPAAAPAPPSAH